MSLILILDDRGTNRKILAQLAVSVEPSAEVVTFGNPLLALAWMDGHRPDLVISDYRMPHLDGAEVAGRIRSKATGADVPIIVVTAYNDPVFRLRALEAGATDFLISPVDHAEFRTRVRNLLALRQHQLQARRQVQALARDLEASERSRHALVRESRESLAQLIDTVPAMISATDRDGKAHLRERPPGDHRRLDPGRAGRPTRCASSARAAWSAASPPMPRSSPPACPWPASRRSFPTATAARARSSPPRRRCATARAGSWPSSPPRSTSPTASAPRSSSSTSHATTR
jgi:CheY-like chemotaxis protein